MFQNISRDFTEEQLGEYEFNNEEQNKSIKEIVKRLIARENIFLYVIAFMISMVEVIGVNDNPILGFIPFGLAFLAAAISNGQAIGIMYIITLLGTFIKFGTNNFLNYFITSLVFFLLVLIIRPKLEENVNEKKKIGLHLFIAVFLVQALPMFFRTFYLYDLLTSLMLGITTYIFYKIFVNSMGLIKNFGSKVAFSIEEVMGTSLLLTIAFSAFGDITVYGFSIKNVLSILIVLILGWKNGMLVGATGGITIGTVLGIINSSEPIIIAIYAVSGMISGILSRFGKLGVIAGFIIGNIIIAYIANGLSVPLIMFQEILIAALGLLAIPNNIKINIEDLFGKTKLLPEMSPRDLEENKDTIYKLNSMSETISDIAESYNEAAATILSEEDLKEQEKANIEIFLEELRQNLEKLEENMLYEDIYDPKDNFIEDIFNLLLEQEVISEKDLVNILAKYNNYIVGFEDTNTKAKEDVYEIVKAINYSYRISKINFIWKKKMDESKKAVSNQLKGVSEAISKMASDIELSEENTFKNEKDEITSLLKQKEIDIKDIIIKKTNSGRMLINVYTNICEDTDGNECNIKKIGKIINKVLKEKVYIQKQECGLRLNKEECRFTYLSDDKYNLQVGMAKSTKANSIVSGDSSIHLKLDDGKYLLAISDGMGSGPEALKSSKIAIKMLERLLSAGFEKETSLKLINSTLSANTEDDSYATLDIQILDLYNGNMEFIKNGACPTYVKRGKQVQLLKSVTLPAGILNNVDLILYDYDLQDGDILVMCTDGIIDSTKEYLNKTAWLQYLLEDIEVNDAQKIADIIIGEAIDNDFGEPKDDMTVIVAKISKKII